MAEKPKLTDVLADKAEATHMAKMFVSKLLEEMRTEKPEAVNDLDWYRTILEGTSERNIRIIHEFCESPLERIFLTSMLMAALKNSALLGFVVTVPMADTERDIREIRRMIHDLRKLSKSGTSIDELFSRLDSDLRDGKIDKAEWGYYFGAIWNYRLLSNEGALHVTPQPAFPKAMPDGKGIRGDVLFWCPAVPSFKVVVECDSYTYHDNHQSFDRDRQRSRVLQAKGFEVLQYSGGEIYRDPVGTAFELWNRLTSKLEKKRQKSDA